MAPMMYDNLFCILWKRKKNCKLRIADQCIRRIVKVGKIISFWTFFLGV